MRRVQMNMLKITLLMNFIIDSSQINTNANNLFHNIGRILIEMLINAELI